MYKLLAKDQTINGEVTNEIQLNFDSDQITLRELIQKRITSEVQNLNKKKKLPYLGLVIPAEIESILNKEHEPKRIIDIEKQIYIALDGFMKNQFFVLVDDMQIDELDYKLKISLIESVQFIKLVPLVGG